MHAAAPEPLTLVHAFLNTRHADGPRERLLTPSDSASWLHKHKLLSAPAVTAPQHRRVVALREGLRAAIAHARGPHQAGDLAVLNSLLRRTAVALQFGQAGEPALRPLGHGVDAALGTIAAAVAEGARLGYWQRMKICANPQCDRVFYDRSKNRSAVWCSSQSCGNRHRVSAHRLRRADAG